jgi:hypothetical protein
MPPAAPDQPLPRLTPTDLAEIVRDPGELDRGDRLFQGGQLSGLSRHRNKIFCEATGGYKITVTLSAKRDDIRGRCTCRAAMTRPFCKHAAALLMAWIQDPEAFAVSESGPPSGDGQKKKAVRQGQAKDTDLMAQGIAQVSTLLRELAAGGVALIGEDRVAQIRSLGEGLRQHKLRRLSARTLELAELLGRAAAGVALPASAYADLLTDLHLSARKLEKHLGGEPLEDRHIEELIGKTWRTASLPEVQGLMLAEYGFSHRETVDGFLIRESRFLDLQSGQHFSEKQILPLMRVRVEPPKRSYQGQVLLNARGRRYPGYPPQRLKLEDLGTEAPLGAEALARLLAVALPNPGAALQAFQEARKDVFAPDRLPVAVRVARLVAQGAQVRAQGEDGSALALPLQQDRALEGRVASALRGVRLLAILGEVDVAEALPMLYPLSFLVMDMNREESRGMQLRAVNAAPAEGASTARRRSKETREVQVPDLLSAARAQGASPAALALAEVQRELAHACAGGLLRLPAREVEPLAARLRDLGLERPAAVVRGLAEKTEATDRLDDFVRAYQVLGIAISRLCGGLGGSVPLEALEPVPTYASVHVRRVDAPLPPAEVMARRVRGDLGRYEAAAHLSRHYEALTADELEAMIYPTWADGEATPFVVHALRSRGRAAVAAAERALRGKGLQAKATAVRVLAEVGGPEAEALLAQAADGAFVEARNFACKAHPWYWEWGGTVPPLRVLAQGALDGLRLAAGRNVADSPALGIEIRERRRRQEAQTEQLCRQAAGAFTVGERQTAVRALAKLGDVGVAPVLRVVEAEDASPEVRAEALLALGLLGDAESVDEMVTQLSMRGGEPEGMAVAAAYALGYVGDARGAAELLRALVDGWHPRIIGDALRALGGVVLGPLLDVLEAHPDLAAPRQAVVHDIVRRLPKEEAAALTDRLARLGIPLPQERAEPGVTIRGKRK